jgi:hypothetical protein
MARSRCPCCGYYTLSQRGKWEICDVCFWEDDSENDEYDSPASDKVYGANGVSLREARENFLEFGASKLSMKPHVRPPRPDELGPGPDRG